MKYEEPNMWIIVLEDTIPITDLSTRDEGSIGDKDDWDWGDD